MDVSKPVIEIVKVQVPLITSDPRGLGLIYAKGRKNLKQQKLDDDVIKAMAGEPKAFFEAEFSGLSWRIGKRVKDQTW
jgi:hypothetical protein